MVAVPVLEFTIVLVCKVDLEIEVDPVDVREPREDKVPQEDPEEVFDNAVVLEFVGLEELVLDCVFVEV